ncbi:MAG TPA: protease complex subunit PrcB family protein, partial [Polyangiales bacterium]|nr:protease complex subunit PrcB family protein [Polyangiales bacterium]
CVMLSALGCAGEVDGMVDSERAALAAQAQELSFSELVDPAGIGTAGQRKTRLLIAAARRYQSELGHAAPAEVDFAAGDAVIFYSAGVRRTGGYDASVQRVVLRGTTLHVTTQLESPGAGCVVTQALSTPYVLAKVRLPGVVRRVRFHARNTVRECREPTFCGGIAALPCPAGQECIDAPGDGCNPDNGGADCGGICVPATDPCATVRCSAGTTCQVNDEGRAECVPDPTTDPCAAVRCRAGTVCQVDEQGGASCVLGGPFCGGIATFPCPGIGECIDDPLDDCDPTGGGADCGGVCICTQTASCPRGTVFDESPKICDCATPEEDPNPCFTVLCPTGTRCELHQGEPTCLSDGSQDCGPAICSEGSVCCNFSCGICTPPGGFCTRQLCLQP